ncbi:MFS transporter [Caldisalinibacter kiritimatiensis]|uniref:Membrane protein, putative n=1 Tax=Caldisalinibacter kiritimatiensis TaxID=1304284 RepID=R1CWI1_9FIRM|nr:MFS transporter [Caldisalinibacter kiritimatiensis]EOD00974.1 membrane protein, putative [Caldisalinibacter kiritimatiensis]
MKLTKQERAWILYDCGNSAYSISITTALLPIYFGMFKSGESMDLGYFNSIASILIAILSPVLGTIADYKDKKKRFFTFFFILGVVFTAALAFVPYGKWQYLVIFYILTSLGFAGANIFYDSFLVDVTTDERMDKVSTKGFAYGYIASIIPFGISLGVVYFTGMDKLLGYQLGFIITALWWGLFTIPMLRNVKQIHYVEPEPKPVVNSFRRLGKTFLNIRKIKTVLIFLIAYFFYIDGVGTIIKMSVPYAEQVLGGDSFDMFILLGILLIIQIVAFPFAIIYGTLAKLFTAKRMIIVGISTYIISCIFAYFITDISQVFILGILIASAQGGIQALSRSYYAKIIPKKNSNEFFGFYNIFGKFAAILGPLVMSLTTDLTGNARYSILSIIPLFIIGLIIFILLPTDKDKIEAIE